MKKILFLMLVFCFVLSGCRVLEQNKSLEASVDKPSEAVVEKNEEKKKAPEPEPEMYTYTMPTGDETENTIEITEKTSEGFFLNASCCSSRLNLGMFSGYFKYTSSDIAEYTGENYDGNRYKITAQLKENKLHIQVTSEEEIAEDRLLEFGMNVRMSGIYELK